MRCRPTFSFRSCRISGPPSISARDWRGARTPRRSSTPPASACDTPWDVRRNGMRLIRSALLLSTLVACHRAGMPSSATDAGVPNRQAPGGAQYAGDRRPATFPASWPILAGRSAVFGSHAMVASDARLASQAGVEIMTQGGNAVDAAVAVGFALAVVYPEAGNIGGGGYMVIHMADGRAGALDYREIAPLAATRNMYVDAEGKLTDKSIVGPLASGVPGAVAGLTAALAKYGTMPLDKVMAPAIRFAEEGIVVDSALARSIANDAKLIGRFGGAELFLPGGKPIPV